VRVSADVFGLAATHDLRIGQVPKRVAAYVDCALPDGLPVALRRPASTGSRIRMPTRGARSRGLCSISGGQLKGLGMTLIPWLQDFSLAHQYGLIEVTDQIAAPAGSTRADSALEPGGRLHQGRSRTSARCRLRDVP
jgi:hypothetical protein